MPQNQTDPQTENLQMLDDQHTLQIRDITSATDESAVPIDIACYDPSQQDRVQHLGDSQYQLTDRKEDASQLLDWQNRLSVATERDGSERRTTIRNERLCYQPTARTDRRHHDRRTTSRLS
jgi:hypothetical protein